MNWAADRERIRKAWMEMRERKPSECADSDLVAGLDEVGLGAFAGPIVIVVAAYSGNLPTELAGINDSKKLSKKKREMYAPLVAKTADYVGVGWAAAADVDDIGRDPSWQLAATRALSKAPPLKKLYVDGLMAVHGYRGDQETMVKGDSIHWQISAASVLAKVLRDSEMAELAESYPGYAWEKNAGYGTKAHQEALRANGATPLHRMSFLKNTL